ncbi:helix-turn-helix domain-containing protein [Paraburkholderia edwinii]|jgi:AraC-like DNA-binding protein|uniref:Helix-turn-helix domain-containing protein n=1 Tax=Paraburkholderia edwinii TaxID=2861782 RepID=A0ABX8UUX4_9BURK|nr:helix-turn-helix domain-containing protein [Paraburkholderia edwinii]QYD72794.1 helix-turn-helix domain-containing protein [Paraburkholderia edwinii]
MKTDHRFYTWNGMPVDHHEWVNELAIHGWKCRLDASHSGPSALNIARAGQALVSSVQAAWFAVSPGSPHPSAAWNEERLIVQVVKSGALFVEQRGQTTRFGPGDVAVLDPQRAFTESFRETTHMSVLSIPKSSLRERGLRDRLPMFVRPNPALADVEAVRGLVLYLASLSGRASETILSRLGEQCIDLMDVLVDDRDDPKLRSSGAANVLLAKQLIARRIGDPDLNAERIAAELNVSRSSLERALRANGLSVMSYVWSLRLERAAQRLLVDTSHGAIKRIIFQCGFSNHAHFSRAFKARYGMTPREYAAENKEVSSATTQQTLRHVVAGVGPS